jgi:hypothetical protein
MGVRESWTKTCPHLKPAGTGCLAAGLRSLGLFPMEFLTMLLETWGMADYLLVAGMALVERHLAT